MSPLLTAPGSPLSGPRRGSLPALRRRRIAPVTRNAAEPQVIKAPKTHRDQNIQTIRTGGWVCPSKLHKYISYKAPSTRNAGARIFSTKKHRLLPSLRKATMSPLLTAPGSPLSGPRRGSLPALRRRRIAPVTRNAAEPQVIKAPKTHRDQNIQTIRTGGWVCPSKLHKYIPYKAPSTRNAGPRISSTKKYRLRQFPPS